MKQFGFTEHTDISDISKFKGTFEIEKILNENFKLSEYSKTIQKIVFVYIAVNSEIHNKIENFIKYRTKSKIVEIGVNLSYKEFFEADKTTALKLLKEAYLTGIETLLSKRKDFDCDKFLVDLQKVF
jgi:hypothetical protein